MIMNGTTPRLLSAWGSLGALALGALLLPVSPTWAQKADEKKEVRIVVESGDQAKAVVLRADAVNANDILVLAAEPVALTQADEVLVVDGKSVTKSDAPNAFFFATDDALKVDGGAITLHGDVKIVSDEAQDSNVNVILKTDDSAISVAADSIDDAIKKIKEQIKSLKEKGGSSEKDKAQQEALAKIAKQLAEIANSNKATAISRDGKTLSRVVIRNVENIKTAPDSPEKKAEIEKARAKVKELSKALAAAQADLAKLQGHAAHAFTFVTPGGQQAHKTAQYKVMALPKLTKDDLNIVVNKKLEKAGAAVKEGKAEVLIKKVEPKVGVGVGAAPKREVEVRAIKVPIGDDDRLRSLEKKLNQLLEEVASLKKSKGD
jgi:hypothetical protein